MRTLYIALFSLLVFAAACDKDEAAKTLPEQSVSIKLNGPSDTVEIPMSIKKDSLFTIGLNALLSGKTSDRDHWVQFRVDTTKLLEYRSRYGAAELLPYDNYLFYKSMTKIPAGASVSDSAKINLVFQTKLDGPKRYILPIVISTVDGVNNNVSKDETYYLVFKTDKPFFHKKTTWTIAAYSSYNSAAFTPEKILDENETTTYWTSSTSQSMPQFVAINFNKTLTFTAVNYYLPTALGYPANGGYATSIKIETSMNGTTWTDRGTFAGNIAGNMQTLDMGGEITANYLRFTALASVKYANVYEIIFISGIKLIP